MRSVLILAVLGVLSLLVFSCAVGMRPAPPPSPALATAPLLEKPDPVILLIEQELPEKEQDGRVLSFEERRALIRKGMLPQGNPNDQVIEYAFFTRSGPKRHYAVKKQPPVASTLE